MTLTVGLSISRFAVWAPRPGGRRIAPTSMPTVAWQPRHGYVTTTLWHLAKLLALEIASQSLMVAKIYGSSETVILASIIAIALVAKQMGNVDG